MRTFVTDRRLKEWKLSINALYSSYLPMASNQTIKDRPHQRQTDRLTDGAGYIGPEGGSNKPNMDGSTELTWINVKVTMSNIRRISDNCENMFLVTTFSKSRARIIS